MKSGLDSRDITIQAIELFSLFYFRSFAITPEPADGSVRHPEFDQLGIYSHRCISVLLSATLRGVNGTC
ncbi:hypothetical protein [Leptolyngbya subtilissima]|uniref:hypothetical protein n=1 Tax=Leptolyngbya subtilissima TaxID=1346803 RepID=UPI001686F33C